MAILSAFGAFERWPWMRRTPSSKSNIFWVETGYLKEPLLFFLKEDGKNFIQRWKRVSGKDLGPKGRVGIIEAEKKLKDTFIFSPFFQGSSIGERLEISQLIPKLFDIVVVIGYRKLVLMEVGDFSFEMEEAGIISMAKTRFEIKPNISRIIVIVQGIG